MTDQQREIREQLTTREPEKAEVSTPDPLRPAAYLRWLRQADRQAWRQSPECKALNIYAHADDDYLALTLHAEALVPLVRRWVRAERLALDAADGQDRKLNNKEARAFNALLDHLFAFADMDPALLRRVRHGSGYHLVYPGAGGKSGAGKNITGKSDAGKRPEGHDVSV